MTANPPYQGKSHLAFYVAIGLLLVFVAVFLARVQQVVEHEAEEQHIASVLIELGLALDDMQTAESAARGFLLTGEEAYLEPYKAVLANVEPRDKALAALLASDPESMRLLPALEDLEDRQFAGIKRRIEFRRQEELAAALAEFETGEGRHLMVAYRESIARLTDRWTARQTALNAELTATATHAGASLAIITLVVTGLLVWSRRAQKRTEAMLRERKAQHRTILESLTEGVVLADADGQVRAVNAAATCILGVTQTQLQRIDLLGKGALRTDGTPLPIDEVPHVRALANGRAVLGATLGWRKPDGAMVWLEVNASPVLADSSQRPAQVVISFADVTERRRAERDILETRQHLQDVIDNSPAMIAYYDCQQRAQLANAAYRAWYGLGDRKIDGVAARDIVGTQTYQASVPHFDAALLGEKQVFDRSEVDTQGRVRHACVTYVPSFRDDAVAGALVLVTDTTELTQRVEARTRELVEARDQAQAASRAKDEFLANVSHEMRTPLHGIQAFTGLAIKRLPGVEDEKLGGYLQRIGENCGRLRHFVDDLLTLAKYLSGKATITPSRVNLHDETLACLALLEPLFAQRAQRVEIGQEASNAVVQADAAMVRQVLTNLLSNAHKFSPSGKPICISFADDVVETRARGAVPALRATISDEGIGIPEEELELIFNEFEQSSRSKSGAGGTGLGLSICRQVMRLHEGTIRARNNPEGGASFDVVFPLRVPTESPAMAFEI